MEHLRFHSENGNGRYIDLQFRSLATAERFTREWQHAGGILQFSYDVYGDKPRQYPVMPASFRTFKLIMDTFKLK